MNTLRLDSSWRLLVAAVILVVVAGCSGSGPSPTEPIADASNGSDTGGSDNSGDGGSGNDGDGGATGATLSIDMIDDPTEDICELWVYIKDIRVKPDEESPVLLGNEIGGWDLLSLQHGNVAPLGTWEVEAGLYQFIEILLDESLSYVIEVNPDHDDDTTLPPCLETQTPLQIPSEKFKVNGGPFSVDSPTTVTIDFDAKRSLKRKGSPNNPQGWQLNPKVSIVDVEVE